MLVYMDLVLILNFLVDFLLLLGTNCISGFPPGYGRSATAALVGSVYAAVCMTPSLAFLGNLFWRIVCLAVISMAAFGMNRSAIRRGAVFLLLSMAMGGLAAASNQNHIGMLLLCALVLWLLCRISFQGNIGKQEYVPVVLSWQGRKLSLIALRDTGNLLRDPVTGEQVFVAGADVGAELLGLTEHQLAHPVETLASGKYPGLRLIPYHAVGQPGGMMVAMRFENAKVGSSNANPLVAFAPNVLARGEVYRMLTGGNV